MSSEIAHDIPAAVPTFLCTTFDCFKKPYCGPAWLVHDAAQWWDELIMHFSEHIPIIDWPVHVMVLILMVPGMLFQRISCKIAWSSRKIRKEEDLRIRRETGSSSGKQLGRLEWVGPNVRMIWKVLENVDCCVCSPNSIELTSVLTRSSFI